jgi:hypothetical protein
VGKWPMACVRTVDELWVTQLSTAKHAGPAGFSLLKKNSFQNLRYQDALHAPNRLSM